MTSDLPGVMQAEGPHACMVLFKTMEASIDNHQLTWMESNRVNRDAASA